jgi:signal transduction histidine kinase
MRRIEIEENELKTLAEKTEQMSLDISRIGQSNEALEKSNIVKDRLLSIISHDLRSPMSSLHVLLNLFNANNIARKDLVDFIGKLLSRVENTTIMLENLLHWSQSQLNRIEPIFCKTNIQEIIDNSISFYRMQAEQKRISIANPSKLPVFVTADVEMLKIVLRNLISNALKFTFEGGSITLNADRRDREVVVSVKDTGVGISRENQDKMFANVNFTTPGTDKEKGTGLGLLLCKDFVEHNRGKLWVESKEGEGATFYFSIPLAE